MQGRGGAGIMNKKHYVILTIAAVLVLLVPIVAVFAKFYEEKDFADMIASSSKFYFTTDLIDDNETSFECDITGGDSKMVIFKVKNYMDAYRVNERETKYTVSMTVENNAGGVAPTLLDSSDAVVGSSTKTLAAGKDHTYKLKMDSGYLDNAVVTVTVNSIEPYEKEMKLIFNLHTYDHRVSYVVSDSTSSPYMELFVTAHYDDVLPGKLKIDWSNVNSASNALQIELGNYVLDADLTLTANKLTSSNSKDGYLLSVVNTKKINMGETVVFRFYKADSSLDYDTELTAASGGALFSDPNYIITLNLH